MSDNVAAAERDAARAECERMRPYIRHRRDCIQDDWNATSERCTCGLDHALANAAAEGGET